VKRGNRLWSGEGIALYETDLADRLMLEFEDEAVCEAAYRIQTLLRRHVLNSSFEERLGGRTFLIRRVEPLDVEVVAEAEPGEVRLAFAGAGGTLTREQALAALGRQSRLEKMEDVGAHAARSLRAHLSLRGIDRLRLRLRFGITADGTCLLQVVNPLGCDLGTNDMRKLTALLGG